MKCIARFCLFLAITSIPALIVVLQRHLGLLEVQQAHYQYPKRRFWVSEQLSGVVVVGCAGFGPRDWSKSDTTWRDVNRKF